MRRAAGNRCNCARICNERRFTSCEDAEKKVFGSSFFRCCWFPDMQNGEMEKREDGKTQSQARNTKDGPFNKCRYIGT